MKCTDVYAQLALLQKQVERELIHAVKAHGKDEYVFFKSLAQFASILDGPFVMVEEPNQEAPIVHIEYNLWIVAKVSVALDKIEVYGFRFEGYYKDDDEAELMGHIEAKELVNIITHIPEITNDKTIQSQ